MHIDVRIEGTTPLIMNKFTDKAALAATAGNSLSTNGDRDAPHDDAASRLYTDHDGNVIVPASNLLSCFTAGGKFHKAGKSKVTTIKSSFVPAAVGVCEMYVPLKEPWEVDTRPVRMPSTGGRILRHRPLFQEWSLAFHLEVKTDILSLSMVRNIVDSAGSSIGLGDFRPECKGPYGRFKVTLWEVDK